jgi:hypothetical protein
MTTQRKRERLSPLFLLLSGVTLALASWGLYGLFTVPSVHMPAGLAVLVVGGLDVAAVAFGKHALTVTEDGDSGLPWNLALVLLTALGAYAQLAHALLVGYPLAVGLVTMAFPIVTVALFEGQLRRRFRLQGRRTGRVPEPRATVDLMTWIFYRQLALRATKLSVLDRGLDPDSALMIAERQLVLEAAEEDKPVRGRRMRRTYAAELAGGEVTDTLHVPSSRVPANTEPDVRTDEPVRTEDEVANVRQRGEIAAAVRNAHAELGPDLDKVYDVVSAAYPGVSRDTVRVTLGRLERTA